MKPLQELYDNVIKRSLSLQASRLDFEHRPENPYGDAELEMGEQMLLEAARELVAAETTK